MPKYLFIILLLLPFCVNGQVITTVVGGGTSGLGDGGMATLATIGNIQSTAFDKSGNLFIADGTKHRIRRVDAVTGVITTIAGTGSAGFTGDGGSAIAAKLNYPTWIAFDPNGNLYINDGLNKRIRKVDMTTNIITTYAGNGNNGYSGDGGQATSAEFWAMQGIAFNSSGDLFVADDGNHKIRKITPAGIINTYAGVSTSGFSGDGGPALNAEFLALRGITVDNFGNVHVADLHNGRVRKIDSSSLIITTVAGNGIGFYASDSIQAINSGLAPWGIDFDKNNNLYIADWDNSRILKVDGAGEIYTVAGNGIAGFSGDGGPAVNAKIDAEGITVDSCDNLFISDFANQRVRKITYSSCYSLGIKQTRSFVFTIHPNPANESITITGNNLQSIRIANTLGQVVHWQKASQEKTVVDVSDLSAGVYFVTVTDAHGGKVVKKVVKE